MNKTYTIQWHDENEFHTERDLTQEQMLRLSKSILRGTGKIVRITHS